LTEDLLSRSSRGSDLPVTYEKPISAKDLQKWGQESIGPPTLSAGGKRLEWVIKKKKKKKEKEKREKEKNKTDAKKKVFSPRELWGSSEKKGGKKGGQVLRKKKGGLLPRGGGGYQWDWGRQEQLSTTKQRKREEGGPSKILRKNSTERVTESDQKRRAHKRDAKGEAPNRESVRVQKGSSL